ncbi:MAG: response regulator [Devosia sp.]
MPPEPAAVLVVEDEPLVAMDMEGMLFSLGCASVAVAYTLEEGLKLADEQKLDFAVLDFNLSRQTDSIPIGQRLLERGVPFVIVTGNARQAAAAFPAASVVSKPLSEKMLGDLLEQATAA